MKPIHFSVPQPNSSGCFFESLPFGRYGSRVNFNSLRIYIISIWLLERLNGRYCSFKMFYWFASHYYGNRYKIIYL